MERELPLQITFRDMPPSPAIRARVQERVAGLDRFHDRILTCHVVVASPHRHRHQGKLFHVRIDVTVPQADIVVNRESELDHAHEDVYVAIRDAFDAIERRLEEHLRRQRGMVKTHEGPLIGRLGRLFPGQGYGFIETPEGREIYFHRNALVETDISQLESGVRVEFVETQGEKGPQASTVRPARRG